MSGTLRQAWEAEKAEKADLQNKLAATQKMTITPGGHAVTIDDLATLDEILGIASVAAPTVQADPIASAVPPVAKLIQAPPGTTPMPLSPQ